jgi:hypothetical protein
MRGETPHLPRQGRVIRMQEADVDADFAASFRRTALVPLFFLLVFRFAYSGQLF